MTLDKFVFDVAVGLVVGLLTLFARWQWPLIRSLFDGESRRQAAQVSGTWKASELFADTNTKNTYTMEIKCRGGKVTGTHICLTGPDEGRVFDLSGSYKDQVLTFAWVPNSREALESGTVTAILAQDKRLAGHGLYIEPGDRKVHTSIYEANR